MAIGGLTTTTPRVRRSDLDGLTGLCAYEKSFFVRKIANDAGDTYSFDPIHLMLDCDILPRSPEDWLATKRTQSGTPQPAEARRTRIVWTTFAAAMSVVAGALAISDRQTTHGGFLAANLAVLGEPAADPLFNTVAQLDRDRWKGIVIHHLGAPVGDPESIHRQHLAIGHQGLGYHFLIGNGSGLGDGVIHAGYRWNEQLPGAHALGRDEAFHNEHSIAICLIGNGDRRPFSERQIAQLFTLVQRLQRELDIPASAVRLHREIAQGASSPVTSPGRYFPAALLEEQLR